MSDSAMTQVRVEGSENAGCQPRIPVEIVKQARPKKRSYSQAANSENAFMTKPKQSAAAAPRYQLKITLGGTKPPVWRRVIVPSTIRLDRLHDVIQGAMGWYDGHLHEFATPFGIYGEPDPDCGVEVMNERKFTLQDIAPHEKATFNYVYDFGDSWAHKVLVEKVLPPDATAMHAVCIAGKNACPPEDCGGIPGYYELLEIMKDPSHEEHERMVEWAGGRIDPTAFSLDRHNARLRGLKT